MSAILGAMSTGYSAKQILAYLSQHNPQMAQQISNAISAGHTVDHILRYLSKNEKKLGKLTSEQPKSANLFQTAQTSIHPSLKGMAQFAGTTALLAGGAYALSRAIPSALSSGIQPGGAGLAQIGLNQPLLPGPQSPIGAPNVPNAPLNPTQAPITPQATVAPTTAATAQQAAPINAVQILSKFPFKEKIDDLIQKGHGPEQIRALFQLQDPKLEKQFEKETGQPFEKILEEYVKASPQEKPQEVPQMQLSEAPEIEEIIEPKKIEKESLTSWENGVGEVREIRGNKALVADDTGKLHKIDVDELEPEPEDLEDVVRELVNRIPEKEKSTALQSAIRIPLPGNKSVTLMKFYDGKIAWYLDVPEETYKGISLGTYEPKGKSKTGIGEYQPGVFDSRGAGFHEQIRMNPLYSKANKGITWGYADNDYDALMKIQPILHKLSKEKYDEEGNLITPKAKKRKNPA